VYIDEKAQTVFRLVRGSEEIVVTLTLTGEVMSWKYVRKDLEKSSRNAR
jgi:hypothetical protein